MKSLGIPSASVSVPNMVFIFMNILHFVLFSNFSLNATLQQFEKRILESAASPAEARVGGGTSSLGRGEGEQEGSRFNLNKTQPYSVFTRETSLVAQTASGAAVA